MRQTCLLLVLLAACTPTIEPRLIYRDADVPLSVTTRGTLADLKGEWIVRGSFPSAASIQSVAFAPRGDGKINVTIRQPDCGESCHILSGTWPAERIAQNRLRLLTDSATMPELWVIWTDIGTRTSVIVTPDGRNAFILDRSAQGGTDRVQAAREILEFNGYDITQLVMH